MSWLLLIGITYAAWKLRPRRLLKDILELEWISSLQHQRNSRPVSAEDIERRFYRKLTAFTAVMFVSILGMLWTVIALIGAMLVAAILSALAAVVVLKLTMLSRTVTTPLYLTLCGIREARWDTHSSPNKWLRIHRKSGVIVGVVVMLPKDWHATTLGINAISSIVQSRIPGMTETRVELDRFRITYSRRIQPICVSVLSVGDSTGNGADTNAPGITSPTNSTQNAPALKTKSFETTVDMGKEGIDAW